MRKYLLLFIIIFIFGGVIFLRDTNEIDVQKKPVISQTHNDNKQKDSLLSFKDDKSKEELKNNLDHKKDEEVKDNHESKDKEEHINKEEKLEEVKKQEQQKENNEDNNLKDNEVLKETINYHVDNNSITYTGLASLQAQHYVVENHTSLSQKSNNFYFGEAKNTQAHHITVSNQSRFDTFNNVLAWDNKTKEKILYLTFDCGYEYKNLTSEILNILNEKNVPAAFFITGGFIKYAPQTVARMINEGYIVGNHTNTHPNSTSISRIEFAKDILALHNQLRVNFGYNSQYFRFPSGIYSEDTLELVNSIGYRSVFWSLAHTDWDPQNQPGVEKSFKTVTSRLHPGAVILLHSTSPDNVQILRDLIDYARNEGYVFKSLNEYGNWK